MTSDQTQQQSFEDQHRAQQLSLSPAQPPMRVPGYEIQQFLGAGAYGEVWVGVDQNTGRRVAIKFYTHRGGLDWALLSREVEKLVFLSADRYVVQLLDVGWDAEPPYYVMEFVENGSLDELLREHGPLPPSEAVELFAGMAVGLVHAHGKGVLHCDLKPANILLDQDHTPRLADFGQSRLSHEQTPALGTLFYMAPEQADLTAVPDARWDVYALGAILYCMLTGQPPYRSEQAIAEIDQASSLEDRLLRYQLVIQKAPRPSAHRKIAGVDRALADIVERCLIVDPEQRFANVQEVLDALRSRAITRSRQPLVILGIVAPILLLLIVGLFAWRGYNRAMQDTDRTVTAKAGESNDWAAQFAAGLVAHKIERYFRAVESVTRDPEFQQLLEETVETPELVALLDELRNPAHNNGPAKTDERRRFIRHEARAALQARIEELMRDEEKPEADSWFVTDPYGTQVASVFDSEFSETVGKNYCWRTYFNGGPEDTVVTEMVDGQQVVVYHCPGTHITSTHLSAVFLSQATNVWKIAVSAPVERDGKFLGVLALTLEMGNIMRFPNRKDQFAVLVDGRSGKNEGVILQHPLFDEFLEKNDKLPAHFRQYRVPSEQLKHSEGLYHDPLGMDAAGGAYSRPWIAARAPVTMEHVRSSGDGEGDRQATGLFVIVQEAYDEVAGPVHDLGQRLLHEAVLAVIIVTLVIFVLWFFVLRAIGEPRSAPAYRNSTTGAPTPIHHMTTVALRK